MQLAHLFRLSKRASTPPADVGGASEGNRLTLTTDGDEAFEQAYDAICRARERVWLETYIVEPDEVGEAAVEALAAAARRGCDVVLLYDRWGSPRFRSRHTAPIREAGGRVAVFNPFWPWRKLGRRVASILHRDHRKILIVDDVGYCGGRNLTREYGGPGPERFYDLTLRVEGPAVRDLASVFLDSLHEATGEALPLPPAPPSHPEGAFADVLELNRRRRQHDLDRAILDRLEAARERCLLATPYFVPPAWFLEALVRAARRGVDVQICTAGESDVPLARTAGRHIYGDVLAPGVRIFEVQHPILHAKFLTIDGRESIVGSYNVDRYSERHNLEVGVATDDGALARRLEAVFSSLRADSEEVMLAAWQQRPYTSRFAQWLLYQLARV